MTAPPRLWRVRARVCGELAALVVTIAVLGQWLTGSAGFDGVQPSPWWIPVMVMALAYGTGPAIAAAAIGSAVWLLQSTRTPAGGDYLDTLFHLSLPPLLWFVAAVLVGEITIMRTRRYVQLQRRADTAQRNVAKLSAAFEPLANANRALQVQVATDPRTTGHVIDLATDLASDDPAKRRAAMAALIGLAAATRDFTVYRTAAGGEAHAWLRGADAQGRPDALSVTLMQALRRRAAILHVGRRSDRLILAPFGIAAVPLGANGTDMPSGCLVLHAAPLMTMSVYRMAELNELTSWLAPLMADDVRRSWPVLTDRVA